MHTSSRRTGRTCEKLPPNAIRKDAPVVGGCREKNQGESFLVDTGHGRFWGWWMWFLVHSPDRHAKFWNIVAFPLAPVGFAKTCQHPLAFVLDRNHQVVFFCPIGRAFKKHPDGLVGTFGDENRMARLDIDGLPRLVQIQAEGFLHIGPLFTSQESVQQSKSRTTNDADNRMTRGWIAVICGFKARY